MADRPVSIETPLQSACCHPDGLACGPVSALRWLELEYNLPDPACGVIACCDEAEEAQVAGSGPRIEENAVTWVERVRHRSIPFHGRSEKRWCRKGSSSWTGGENRSFSPPVRLVQSDGGQRTARPRNHSWPQISLQQGKGRTSAEHGCSLQSGNAGDCRSAGSASLV
jgi:hypothetical protein